MAGGWAKDGAVQEQIDASVADAVKLARQQLPSGISKTHCEECGAGIPEARQMAIPGVKFCVVCQSELEKENIGAGGFNGGFNRRGSKDSQLK